MFNNKEYVLAVHKFKSFSKAAKELYISQPSLSASVKRIEAAIGAPLFDRSTNPLSLTEIGEKYIKCATDIANIEENFESFVSNTTKMLKGEIKIGGSSMFSSFVLPALISKFNTEYPGIEFKILEDNTQNLMSMLVDGSVDLVVDNVLISNKSVVPYAFTPELLMLAVPLKFKINERLKGKALTVKDIKEGYHKREDAPAISLKEFENEPFILLKSENDTGKRAVKLFKKYDISPKVVFKLDQQMTAYNITNTGVGISFISDTLISHLYSSPNVCYYKIDDPDVVRNIYFYVKANRYLSNACQTFMDMYIDNK